MNASRSTQGGLKQIQFSGPPGHLAAQIIAGFVQTYGVDRGLSISNEHRAALEQIAIAIQMMAEGDKQLPPVFLLSTLPTGAGKTTLMVEAVKAIVADRAYAHVGLAIFVSYLSQIPILVKEMGLREDQYAVRTGKRNVACNGLGLTALMKTEKDRKNAHRQAQVLFTTHAKVRAVAQHQRNFVNSPFFEYQGTTRQIRIWDEAIMPAEPIVLTTKEVKQYVRRLRGWKEDQAAAVLDEWVAHLSALTTDDMTKVPLFMLQMPFPPDDVDDDLQAPSERASELYESDLAQKMWLIAGQKARVHFDVHTGTAAITYRESLPREFAPLLILDAGGELAMTYHAWGEGRGNLRELMPLTKTYRNLTTHFWEHRAGKSAHRDNGIAADLAKGVACAVAQIRAERNEEKILVVHRKHEKPYADMKRRIRRSIEAMGLSTKNVCFLHYGCHTAVNSYKDFKHVILVGLLQYSDPAYHALWRAAKGAPSYVPAVKEEVAKLRIGTIETHLLQAAGRSAIRKMVNGDVPEGCHLWVVFSSWAKGKGGVSPQILTDTFPGTKMCRWQPLPEKLRAGARRVVEAVVSALGLRETADVPLTELSQRAGLTWAPTQGHLRSAIVLRDLCRLGISVEGPKPISFNGVVVLKRGCEQRLCEPIFDQLRRVWKIQVKD